MERNEFLAKFGIGLLAVCAGCGISSCGSNPGSDPAPTPTNPTPPASGNLLSVDLNAELKNVGDSKVANQVILVRTATGNSAASFTAVQVACTHQGTSINYSNGQGIFVCPNHGSQFSKTGSVLVGPATVALKQYTVIISGNTLNVVA